MIKSDMGKIVIEGNTLIDIFLESATLLNALYTYVKESKDEEFAKHFLVNIGKCAVMDDKEMDSFLEGVVEAITKEKSK